MQDTTAQNLRQAFLDYFRQRGHEVVASSPLVPANDPTLMFTNAGMVQFKDVFVGLETRPYKRAATCQKCMRVSGKHNDLEEVGRSPRHQTFFEMLGNFSFGDYFKEEAIAFAWEFVTRELGLPAERIWVTVFGGDGDIPADTEARSLWRKIAGLPDERIVGLGMDENFWAMGETGPCGPCTELHIDTGSGPVKPEDFHNGRILEFWNNVFMQFERSADGTLTPLPKPSVDTGMGLERLAAILQGKHSNYETDLFVPLLQSIAEAAGKRYHHGDSDDDMSMRVIADHGRATAFLIADGVQPSNEGRGYVLRRIMRRAIRHGRRLGFEDLFFNQVCAHVVAQMQDVYPELRDTSELIDKVAQMEERNFRRTLDTGLRILRHELEAAQTDALPALPGATVFKLYDTYGFPKDLTEVIAAEHGLGIDEVGFQREMAAQQARSRGGDVGDKAVERVYKELASELGGTTFIGYPHEDEPLANRAGEWRRRDADGTEYLEAKCRVAAILVNGERVSEANSGLVELVLEPTPFYGESGGQIGDRGVLVDDANELTVEIVDTQKPVEGLTVSKGRILAGALRQDQSVWAGYVPHVRKQVRAHHSATHLLHGALREVLGNHVKQAGSLVDADRLRFDYSHFEAPSAEQLHEVEDVVNGRIQSDHPVVTEVLPFEEARAKGAIAFFGEKYGDTVRVISMGPSIELCGGTHARRTRDMDLCLIIRDESIAAGVRRIEAVVADAARQLTRQTAARLALVSQLLRGDDVAAEAIEGNKTLQAVSKAVQQARALADSVAAADGEPAPARVAADAPELPEDFGLAHARAVRDSWQAISQLTQAKGNELEALTNQINELDGGNVVKGFAQLLQGRRRNERLREQARQQRLHNESDALLHGARRVGNVNVLAAEVHADPKALRQWADQLRDKLGSGVICLGTRSDAKVTLLVAVSRDLTNRLNAGQLIRELAPVVGGRGGGKPELAQAGGSEPAALPRAFETLERLVGQLDSANQTS